MADRISLHNTLKIVLGSNNVYFVAPSNERMQYPCIKYSESKRRFIKADDSNYKKNMTYTITIIDEDPESEIPNRLEEALPYCSHDRTYYSDGLHHFVYNITLV